MRRNRVPRILAAAALSVLALSLTQCIIVPHRVPGSAPQAETVQIVTPHKQEEVKPSSPPRPVYRVGDVVSVTGIMRHDGMRYVIDDDRSSAIFKFTGNKVSEAETFKKNLNRRISVRLRILSAAGQVYEADFISFGG
jgi:hypothetical protein